ncbi:peroxisomal membrane protein pex14 [Tulasnella sp. 424]|nr:peroxisomal membrane protein pex14 [Tulasnella sp. 424]
MRSSIISNAVSFLRDSSTQESPLDKRIEFLRVKGLTQEEIDAALAQVGITRVDAPIASSSTVSTAEGEFFAVPVTTQPKHVVPQYHNTVPAYNYAFDARRMPPPQREKDWKDWFVSWFTCELRAPGGLTGDWLYQVMAVVSGTVAVGAYSLAKKFLFPHLTPPPLDAFQQTQASLEAQFDAISKQLADLQTESDAQRKIVEASKDEVARVVSEVDAALRELKLEEEKAKLELKEIREEVGNVRELVPKLIQSSQASATNTLADVQAELKSLKTLLLSRPSQPTTPSMGYPQPPPSSTALPYGVGTPTGSSTANLPYGAAPGLSSSPPPGPNSGYLLSGRPSIPAWQLAAAAGTATRSTSSPAVPTVVSTTTTTTTNTASTDITSSSAFEGSAVLVQSSEAEH